MIARLAIGLVVVTGAVVAAPRSPEAPRLQWAVAVLPSGHEIDLDLALDPASQARGLAGRERVAPDEGFIPA